MQNLKMKPTINSIILFFVVDRILLVADVKVIES